MDIPGPCIFGITHKQKQLTGCRFPEYLSLPGAERRVAWAMVLAAWIHLFPCFGEIHLFPFQAMCLPSLVDDAGDP